MPSVFNEIATLYERRAAKKAGSGEEKPDKNFLFFPFFSVFCKQNANLHPNTYGGKNGKKKTLRPSQ
jgi:hypothetical protein